MSMPRPYRLGRRADAQVATRERILAAALRLYRDGGLAAATTRAVATVADVAPATVRNHFPSATDLAIAAGASMLEELRPPDPSTLKGLPSIAARVERLTRELIAFFDRGESWWWVIQRDPELAKAWAGVTEAYDAGFIALVR